MKTIACLISLLCPFLGFAQTRTHLTSSWANETWINTRRDISSYITVNENCLTDTVLYQFHQNTGLWVNDYRLIHEYDANGNRLRELREDAYGTSFISQWDSYHTYNDQNQLVTDSNLTWNNLQQTWSTSWKAEYEYDANHFLTQLTYYVLESQGWVIDQRLLYTNNSSGLPVEIITQFNAGNTGPYNGYLNSIVYENNHKISDALSFAAGNGWQDPESIDYFEWTGDLMTADSTVLLGSSNVAINRHLYTYDNDGSLLTALYQNKENGAWINSTLDEYSGGCNLIEKIENEKTNATALVFPNPAHEFSAISFYETFTGQLILSDMYGKITRAEKITSEKNHVLELQFLAPGFYMLRLIPQTGNEVVYRIAKL